MKRLLIFASLLAMAFACTPEEKPNNNGGNNGTEDNGNEPAVETYATFTATLEGSTVKTEWAEGDEIRVICVKDNIDKESVYVLTAGAGTASGTFSPKEGVAALEKGGSGYFAVYPNDQDMTFAMHNTFATTLPAEQTAATPIFAYATDAATLNFSSILGAVKVAFTGTGNIGAVTVTDKKAKNILFGNTTYNCKTGKSETRNGSATKNSVTRKLAAAVELNETTPAEFVVEVPKTTLAEGATISLLDLNGAVVATQEIPGVTIEVGKITDGGTYAIKAEVVTFDLSSTAGPANSYIIPDVGSYKFPVVKGNDNSAKLAAAASAAILYETYNSAEAVTPNSLVKEIAYEDGYVVFETPETYKDGNAVVCVKDAEGNTLWAWHLWFTKDVIPTITYGAQELMDRNLGALGNTPEAGSKAYGLMYQWGRPSPFVGVVDALAEELVAMTTAPAYEEVFTKLKVTDETYQTPEYGVAHPTEFLYGKYCWYQPFDQQLWAEAKTIYDPCPPGYIVPADDSALWDGDSAEKVGETGWKFNGAYYPIAGFWKYSGDWYRNDMTYLFTTTMHENASQGGFINVQIVKYNSSEGKRSYDRKAALCNVRCAKVN